MYKKLERIFQRFLGETSRGVSERGQAQYDCPYCNGIGKNNLEVNFPKGVYNSWCCPENSGRLSYLIKQFGNQDILKDYFQEIQNIRESALYRLDFSQDDFEKPEFVLPKCCVPINKNLPEHQLAYNYLIDRGLNDTDIRKHNIYCTGKICNKCTTNCKYRFSIRNRIIFTNWSFGNIDYWIGRLYKENKYQTKYIIPLNSNKREIIWGYNNIQFDGEIRLVEGILDGIPLPSNAIPILGKKLNSDFRLFHVLMEKASSVLLIPDNEEKAYKDWVEIYNILNVGRLKGKVRIVDWNQISTPLDCDDNSSLYKVMGKNGVIKLLQTATFL